MSPWQHFEPPCLPVSLGGVWVVLSRLLSGHWCTVDVGKAPALLHARQHLAFEDGGVAVLTQHPMVGGELTVPP